MRALVRVILGVSLGFGAVAWGQGTAPAGHSLLHRDEVDVTVYTAPEGQSLNLKTGKGDAVAVISDSVSWTPATEMDSEGDSEPGEPLFLEQGSKRLFYSSEGERMAFSVYLIELKHHWVLQMNYCENPKKCIRRLKTGQRTVGMSKAYFSNGDVGAARYQLSKGGTFAANYSTPKNPCDVVLVTLGPVTTEVNGETLELKAGEAHLFTQPASIVFRADRDNTMWVAVRIPPQ